MNLPNIPEYCFTTVDGLTVLIKKGRTGYFDYSDSDCDAEALNESLGIDEELRDCMVGASMFGWDKPIITGYRPS